MGIYIAFTTRSINNEVLKANALVTVHAGLDNFKTALACT